MLEKPERNSRHYFTVLYSSGFLLSTTATNFVSLQRQKSFTRESQQKVLRETLQCATERRVCCSGVRNPYHGQTALPGDSGRAWCGVCRCPNWHRDLQPTRSKVLFFSAAAGKECGPAAAVFIQCHSICVSSESPLSHYAVTLRLQHNMLSSSCTSHYFQIYKDKLKPQFSSSREQFVESTTKLHISCFVCKILTWDLISNYSCYINVVEHKHKVT